LLTGKQATDNLPPDALAIRKRLSRRKVPSAPRAHEPAARLLRHNGSDPANVALGDFKLEMRRCLVLLLRGAVHG